MKKTEGTTTAKKLVVENRSATKIMVVINNTPKSKIKKRYIKVSIVTNNAFENGNNRNLSNFFGLYSLFIENLRSNVKILTYKKTKSTKFKNIGIVTV